MSGIGLIVDVSVAVSAISIYLPSRETLYESMVFLQPGHLEPYLLLEALHRELCRGVESLARDRHLAHGRDRKGDVPFAAVQMLKVFRVSIDR